MELVVIGRAFAIANIYAVACLPLGVPGIQREGPSAPASGIHPCGAADGSTGFTPMPLWY